MALLDEGNTTCCYARSEKHWVTDPQGIAWEHFHTLGNIPVFNEASRTDGRAPAARRRARGKPVGSPGEVAVVLLLTGGRGRPAGRGCHGSSYDHFYTDGSIVSISEEDIAS